MTADNLTTTTNNKENSNMNNRRIIVKRRTNAGSGWYPQWERTVVATRSRRDTTPVGTIYGPNEDGQFHLGLTFPDGERDVYNVLSAGYGGGFDTITQAKQAIVAYYAGDRSTIRI